ncbi:hypothetical protein TNCV_4189921 [Trichonephila clavipes]|nr:hypothetical protein TNCV_4189921 [Trichonephila clavipes]
MDLQDQSKNVDLEMHTRYYCLLMGGRRSPKLQRQFVHLPCLQETDLKGISGMPQVNGLYGGRSCILAQLVGQSEL